MAWGLFQIAVALLLTTLSVFGALDLRDWAGLCGLVALPISALLVFGGFERRWWFPATLLTMVAVGLGALTNAWLTTRLLTSAGVPKLMLLELSAVLIILGAPLALFSGLLTALTVWRGWLRRPIGSPLP